MKIMIVIWSLAPENGGPTRSTIGLSKALAKSGAEVTVFASVPRDDIPNEKNLRFVYGNGINLKSALVDIEKVITEVKPDVIHVQGIWKMTTHAASLVAKKAGVPIVVSPHGMLDPWALSVKKWKKRLGMLLYQKADLERAAAFHATCEAEASNIRRFGIRQKVFTVPNVVDLPTKISEKIQEGTRTRTALFLSRLHPGKGLIMLAEAWAKLRPEGWKMLVVGPDERGHRAEVEEKVRQLGIEGSWEFYGPVDDAEKWAIYNSADLFIHPSASENFCLSIAEALASGLPVITTKGCPWSEIDGKCGWWIDRTVDDLIESMRFAMSLSDEERYSMGMIGRNLIPHKYSWSVVAKKMIEVYETVLCR